MRMLMVSTEYPPLNGGVGRYTSNLAHHLREFGVEVLIACDEKAKGEFPRIAPRNKLNSEVLLGVVRESAPDVVHVQFEPGLYGLDIDPRGLNATGTYIDSFYKHCTVPIVTTFHTTYSLHDWISQANLVKKHGRLGRLGIPMRFLVRLWKYSLSYKSFHNMNTNIMKKSRAGVVFSKYMAGVVPGTRVIYHGAEPAMSPVPSKQQARTYLSLPQEKKIALAFGFRTKAKGWGLLQKVDLPAELDYGYKLF